MTDELLPPNLDQNLIAAQPVDPALRHKYEQELNAMLETPLNTTRRISFSASVVLSSVMAIALTMAAISNLRKPPVVPIALAVGAAYAVAWVVIGVRVLRRGSQHARRDVRWMSTLPWLLAVALMTLLMIGTGQHTDSIRSVWMLIYGLTFVVMASMFVVQYAINDARLKVEERLLETQLKIAELSEEIRSGSRKV